MPLMFDAASLPPDAIEVGRIQDAWGVKGWMKIHAFNNDPQAFFTSKRWYLQVPEPRAGVRINFEAFTGTVLFKVLEAKEHSSGVVVTTLDVQDRTGAESLKGARIFIPRSSFPTPAKDEFYWVDLLGHSVINREGVVLGKVDDLHSTGPNTVLILGKIMIPFVSVYIDSVDHETKTIRVDWQENYLD
jgi:16S rRNA processing protein RimM